MYHFQRLIVEEAKKYPKPPVLNGSAREAMASLTDVDLNEGSPIEKSTHTSIVGHDPVSQGVDELNKRAKETLKKYQVPPSFTSDYGKLRNRKDKDPGSRIMWSKDDRDLDVIPAKDVQKFEKDGWVIIEGVMIIDNRNYLIALEG